MRASRAERSATGAAFGALLWVALRALGVWDLVSWQGAWGLIGAVLAGAAAWPWRAARVAVWGLLVAAAAVAGVVVTTPATRALVAPLVRRDPLPAGAADAVVVLSAGVTDAGMLNQPAVDRLVSALRLVRDGRARVLVVTRPAYAARHGHVPDEDWRRFLALLPAVPPVAVVDLPSNTHDEALGAASLARTHGWRRVLLVTSPAHTRRACATFERVGLPVTCVPSESRDVAMPLLESGPDRLAAFADWLYETVGWQVYRLRGWV